MKKKLLIIAGPTAVGKTSFSIECAKKFNGEIISADSIQIYKHLNIGSAKVTKEEMQGVPHHLIDVVSPDEEFSVSLFSEMAREKIDEITSRGKLPVLVGGTGLFIKSILYPMSFGESDKDIYVRQKWEKFLEENGVDALWNELYKIDKESAINIEKNNTRRVIRAIEIFELTGKKKSEQNDFEKQSDYDYYLVFLTDDRQKIYDNINKRVDIMFDNGLVKEVEDVVKKYNLNRDSQSMQGIGYKEFFDYFDGKITLEEVKEKIKVSSRHYAKRQFTFFKGFEGVIFLNKDNMDFNLNQIENFLNRN